MLVAVSVSDLLARPAAERAQHAETVRARLQELHGQLGMAFPIYLMVTKADLLAGFMGYFVVLDKDQRNTPWGLSFPRESQAPLGRGRRAAGRLGDGLVARLLSERDPARHLFVSVQHAVPTRRGGWRMAFAKSNAVARHGHAGWHGAPSEPVGISKRRRECTKVFNLFASIYLVSKGVQVIFALNSGEKLGVL